MGFRLRRSIKLGPGLRANLSKSAVGLSAGPRGLHYSVNTSGRTWKSVGVPGTGMSYVKTGTVGSGGGRGQAAAQAVAPTPIKLPKPGMTAPKHEKAFVKAVEHFLSGRQQEALALFREASLQDTKEQALSDDFFAGLVALQLGDPQAAIPYLEKVVADPVGLPDWLMQKYVGGGSVSLPVTSAVTIEVAFDSLGAALALAECYQTVGRTEEAIGLLQQLVELDPNLALVLSLCELYYLSSAWDDLIDLAAGTQNTDDATLQIMVYQARALWTRGMKEPALEVYKAALRSTKRNPELLKEARYCRGALYYELGQKARAKADFAKVYADDPHYEQIGDWLQALG